MSEAKKAKEAKKVKYKRPSGSTIELLDTPEMEKLAKANGWAVVK
jgi:hypothetical protein